MSSNILKAKKALVGKMLVAAALSSSFFGCTMDPYIITAEEQYTRNFIKDFGLVDEKQDWNLAKSATVTVNLGPEMRDEVKVYGKHQSKYYLLAELTGLSGKVDVPVDLPKDCHDLLVVTGGRKYYGNLGSTIDCADMSRGIPNSTYDDDGANPNPDLYTNTESGYTVTVKHTTRGNGGEGTLYAKYNDGGAYQYFNTQQMSPLISTTPWDTYYSANTQKWTENPNGWVGLLPESGVFNRVQHELTEWLDYKRNVEKQSIVRDFRINTGDDGSFTIFPYYYGTNLKHELGVYLLDDEGNPILKSGTYDAANPGKYKLEHFVSFPVFQDRAPGDLQVQPHYDGGPNGIQAIKLTSKEPKDITDDTENETPVFEVGTEYNLQEKVRIKRNGEWMTYQQYINTYGKTYHSRVAYHFWIDNRKEGEQRPDSFARISNEGIVTPLKPTKGHNTDDVAYANVAIATGLGVSTKGAGIGRIKGVEASFNYKVEAGSGINSIDIAESELNMCTGQKRTLTVTLKDKDGKILNISDYWDKISVTEDWDKDKCHIYKDEASKSIKVEALGRGEFWPTVYVTTSGPNGISAYAHVVISSHSFSETYTAVPDDIDWQSYFEEKELEVQNILGNIDNATISQYGASNVSPAAFANVTTDYNIVFELSGPEVIYLAYSWNDKFAKEFEYIVGEDKKTSNEFKIEDSEITSFEVPVQEWMIDGLTNIGLLIHAAKNGCKIMKLELKPDTEGKVHTWKQGGRDAAEQDLTKYYSSHKPETHDCSICGATDIDFSKAVTTVKISDDADFNNIKYTVTWTLPAGQYTVSKHRPAARMSSRSVSSREYDADASHLNPGPASDWRDVNSFWSRLLPHQEEVASYPPNVCMLARSRGYDVIITYGTDENGKPKPWKGNLGMYLKILGSYDIVGDKEEGSEDTYTEYSGDDAYVVFSQNRFNKAADGSSSNQISALSVKHPASGRTFLTFEDMRLTDNNVTPAQYWKRSSDRDVNDLIFNITNFGNITNDDPDDVITEDPEEPVDDTNSWLWAVEDLGATDDFDFNDMVMKINSVTRNSVKKDDKGNVVGDPTLMFKKVTFTPLCAGGTLPLFVHYAPEAVGTHYTLRPGAYVEPNLEYSINDSQLTGTLPTSMSWLENDGDDDAEIHRWFGVDNSTEMINTRSEGATRTVKEGCTLYLNTAFTISGFGQDGSAKGRRGGLYVTVNDGRSVQLTDEITSGWKNGDDGESWVIMSPKEGSASQMFMIVDSDTPWRWPTERTHILNPYPKFTDWVGDMNVTEKWYNLDSNRVGYTFPRYDLKK